MDIEARIRGLKAQIDGVKSQRMEMDAKLKALAGERDAILDECKVLEVPDPKEIAAYIAQMEAEIFKAMGVAEEMLTRVAKT